MTRIRDAETGREGPAHDGHGQGNCPACRFWIWRSTRLRQFRKGTLLSCSRPPPRASPTEAQRIPDGAQHLGTNVGTGLDHILDGIVQAGKFLLQRVLRPAALFFAAGGAFHWVYKDDDTP